MKLQRRHLLQTLGLGALTGLGFRSPLSHADGVTPPLRIVFFVTPHGHVPRGWKMPMPGQPTEAFAELALVGVPSADFSPVLQPLHPYRDRLLVVEGLARTSALHDIAEITRTGTGDLNNHSIGVAHVLTGGIALQRAGSPCTGGMRSIDQELAVRTIAPGRFGSRVYGFDYGPNGPIVPFSFLGSGQATPIVASPRTAFGDLMGYYHPPATSDVPTREARLAAMRPQVLDAVAREYAVLAPQLGTEAQQKLLDHRDLIRQLQASLGAGPSAKCDPTVTEVDHVVTQFMRLTKMAFACDLTRVVTFVAPVLEPADLGYPASETMHGYAHQSIEGAPSCGQTFNPMAEKALIDLNAWYAGQFATLLRELDSVAEGTGTLLDHTLVVWTSELATPTHEHTNTCTILAGGANNFFKMGRYVRYPTVADNPLPKLARVGPAHNRLLVSLLQAFGQSDTSFGLTSSRTRDGLAISLTGALTELHRA